MADPQVWQINLNGSSVKVEDLPLAAIDRIAKANNQEWFVVVNTPLLDLAVGLDLVGAAAEHLGLTTPPDPTVRQLVGIFALVPDTVPEPDDVEENPLGSSGPASGTAG